MDYDDPKQVEALAVRRRILRRIKIWIVAIVAIVAIVVVFLEVTTHWSADYIQAEKIKEAISAASTCQEPFAQFVASHGRLPNNALEVACQAPTSNRVTKFEITGAQIKVTIRVNNSALDGKIISLQALDGNGRLAEGNKPVVSWYCSTDAKEYLRSFPDDCRQSLLPER